MCTALLQHTSYEFLYGLRTKAMATHGLLVTAQTVVIILSSTVVLRINS
jgi:hypothetical protein